MLRSAPGCLLSLNRTRVALIIQGWDSLFLFFSFFFRTVLMVTPGANVHTSKTSPFNHIINIYVCVHCRLWSLYSCDCLKCIVGINSNVVWVSTTHCAVCCTSGWKRVEKVCSWNGLPVWKPPLGPRTTTRLGLLFCGALSLVAFWQAAAA